LGLPVLLLFAAIASPAVGEESTYDEVMKLLAEKKYEEALEAAEGMLVDPELAAMAHSLKGQALHGLGRFAEAKEAYLRSRDLAEKGSALAKAARRNAALMEALRAEGSRGRDEGGEGAWRIFDEALRIDPECAYALLRRGKILVVARRPEEGRKTLERVLNSADTSRRDRAEALYWFGRLEFEGGDFGAARKRFADLVAADPEYPGANHYLALTEKTIETVRRTIRTETRLALALAALLLGYALLGALAFRALRKREWL
jgi:tetratricopeptide (TPR) repeat protein